MHQGVGPLPGVQNLNNSNNNNNGNLINNGNNNILREAFAAGSASNPADLNAIVSNAMFPYAAMGNNRAPPVAPPGFSQAPSNAVDEAVNVAGTATAKTYLGKIYGEQQAAQERQQQQKSASTTTCSTGSIGSGSSKPFCDVCKMRLNSVSQYEAHVMGRKHAEKLVEIKEKEGKGKEGVITGDDDDDHVDEKPDRRSRDRDIESRGRSVAPKTSRSRSRSPSLGPPIDHRKKFIEWKEENLRRDFMMKKRRFNSAYNNFKKRSFDDKVSMLRKKRSESECGDETKRFAPLKRKKRSSESGYGIEKGKSLRKIGGGGDDDDDDLGDVDREEENAGKLRHYKSRAPPSIKVEPTESGDDEREYGPMELPPDMVMTPTTDQSPTSSIANNNNNNGALAAFGPSRNELSSGSSGEEIIKTVGKSGKIVYAGSKGLFTKKSIADLKLSSSAIGRGGVVVAGIGEGKSRMRSDYSDEGEGIVSSIAAGRAGSAGRRPNDEDGALDDNRSEMEEGQIQDDSMESSQNNSQLDQFNGERTRRTSRRESISSPLKAQQLSPTPASLRRDRLSKSCSSEGVASNESKGLHPKQQEHGSAERFAKPLETSLMSFYKQKVCNHWEKYNKCPYGTLCHFLHPTGEKRKQYRWKDERIQDLRFKIRKREFVKGREGKKALNGVRNITRRLVLKAKFFGRGFGCHNNGYRIYRRNHAVVGDDEADEDEDEESENTQEEEDDEEEEARVKSKPTVTARNFIFKNENPKKNNENMKEKNNNDSNFPNLNAPSSGIERPSWMRKTKRRSTPSLSETEASPVKGNANQIRYEDTAEDSSDVFVHSSEEKAKDPDGGFPSEEKNKAEVGEGRENRQKEDKTVGMNQVEGEVASDNEGPAAIEGNCSVSGGTVESVDGPIDGGGFDGGLTDGGTDGSINGGNESSTNGGGGAEESSAAPIQVVITAKRSVKNKSGITTSSRTTSANGGAR